MFETKLTLVGTIISEIRLTHTRTNEVPVANFSIATTARSFNREKGGWVDGNSLHLRVSCWRRLGENVAASLHRGDPVLVSGNLYSRSYEAPDGTRRWSYEVEAATVGPDLSRGTATFQRRTAAQAEQPEQPAPATVVALGGGDPEPTGPQSEAA